MPWGNWTCSATVHVKPSTQLLRWAAPKLLWLAYFDGNLMSQTSGSKYIGIGFIAFLKKFWWRLLFLWKGVSHVSSEFCSQCVGGKNQNRQTSKNAKLLRALTVIPDSWPHGEIFGLCFCCLWGQVMQSEIQVLSLGAHCLSGSCWNWLMAQTLTSPRSQSTSDLVMAEEGISWRDLTWLSESQAFPLPLPCPGWNFSTLVISVVVARCCQQ